ncbi:T9SS type A sorting domain-containing protein, partial [Flagellimonas zhangzhouensis]
GNSSTEADPVHTYTSAGVYIAELTVTDGEAQTDTDTVTISVTGPITEGVLSFTLIDALNNSDMFELVDGQVLDFGTTGGLDLNIRANASENTGRVSFVLTGPVSNTKSEGVAPYALFGDISGNYNQVDLPLGDYILSATGSSGGVTIGQPLTIEFSIVSGATAKGIDSQNLEESLDSMGNVDEVIPFDIILYPNPGATQITISTKSLISEVMDIRIFDSTGQLVRSFSPTEFKDGSDYTLPIQSLQAAVYHLGILTQDGKTYFKQMIVRK